MSIKKLQRYDVDMTGYPHGYIELKPTETGEYVMYKDLEKLADDACEWYPGHVKPGRQHHGIDYSHSIYFAVAENGDITIEKGIYDVREDVFLTARDHKSHKVIVSWCYKKDLYKILLSEEK